MGYQVKWIEEHLGVSRKALRNFENRGLMPKNQNNEYRNYSEEDVERIWNIRMLQAMGFTVNEIARMAQDADFDFQASMTAKVKTLEADKAAVEEKLGFAEMIKLTGRVPVYNKAIGTMKWEDYKREMLRRWNTRNDPAVNDCCETVDRVLHCSAEEWMDSDIVRLFRMLDALAIDAEKMASFYSYLGLLRGVFRRKNRAADDPEVQLLMRLLYEEMTEIVGGAVFTEEQFGRLHAAAYMEGEIGLLNQQNFGADACFFLADATAVFGGYKDYNDTI